MEIFEPILPPLKGYVEIVDENGEHVYSPTPETITEQKRAEQMANMENTVGSILNTSSPVEFNKVIQLFANLLDDETMVMTIATVYPEYKVGVAYKTKDKFRYGTNSVGDPQLYQVLQDHTSAAEWTPDSAVSLYKKIGISKEGVPLWVQPLGATDAYELGDVVFYNGKKYKSKIDANVWSPDAYPAGWELLDDTEPTDPEPTDPEPEEPEEPDTPTVPEFVQPTGAHDAYKTGDRVLYNGQVYESLMDGNVWSPDAYPAGWQLVTE